MDLKTRFESHPAIFGLSLIVAGFVAGFEARPYFQPSTTEARTVAPCNIEGVEALTQGHNSRMETLQKTLAGIESQIAETPYSSVGERYTTSADHVRQDMAEEVNAFKASVAALSKKCVN